jgi:hypothetical protein
VRGWWFVFSDVRRGGGWLSSVMFGEGIISIQTDKTYHSRQTKHINPDRQNISFQTNKTYQSRQTKHIIPDRQNISFQTDKTYHSR